jgi:Fe-Mn family superoxide dismutase
MAFELPKLPYAYDALEPHIDARTMEIHHTKHHQTYITKANAALEGTALADVSCGFELCARLGELPADKQGPVRNNGGGHANHSLFWEILGPGGGGPSGALASAINDAFGNLDGFKEQLTAAGVNRFGSGWAWLCKKEDGKLCVCSTPNQDNPVMHGLVDCPGKPILGVDVWEHAYYLNYQNRRPDYLAAFFNVINWNKVGELFEK